jgi:hypothetical protein
MAIWNVRTMLLPGKMQEISKEIMKYKIDIIALQELRWQGQGTIDRPDYCEIYKSSKDKMVGACRKNVSGSNAKKDDGRKIVHRKKKRKTSFEMDRRCCSRYEDNGDKAVDGEDERQTAVETGC